MLLGKRYIVNLMCVGQAWDLDVWYQCDDQGTGSSRLAGDRVSNDLDSLHEGRFIPKKTLRKSSLETLETRS